MRDAAEDAREVALGVEVELQFAADAVRPGPVDHEVRAVPSEDAGGQEDVALVEGGRPLLRPRAVVQERAHHAFRAEGPDRLPEATHVGSDHIDPRRFHRVVEDRFRRIAVRRRGQEVPEVPLAVIGHQGLLTGEGPVGGVGLRAVVLARQRGALRPALQFDPGRGVGGRRSEPGLDVVGRIDVGGHAEVLRQERELHPVAVVDDARGRLRRGRGLAGVETVRVLDEGAHGLGLPADREIVGDEGELVGAEDVAGGLGRIEQRAAVDDGVHVVPDPDALDDHEPLVGDPGEVVADQLLDRGGLLQDVRVRFTVLHHGARGAEDPAHREDDHQQHHDRDQQFGQREAPAQRAGSAVVVGIGMDGSVGHQRSLTET